MWMLVNKCLINGRMDGWGEGGRNEGNIYTILVFFVGGGIKVFVNVFFIFFGSF